jgi:hypothetical protein
LYRKGLITEAVAIAEADNPANLRLMITQNDVQTNSKETVAVRTIQRAEKPQIKPSVAIVAKEESEF